ncbi:Callose synthase 3 [Raphanus sativus]|nr:Callose synthase 3 [Raphanus sativus]
MPAEANNLPDSEAVPSGLREVSLILRVAHKIHPTHPRIAYLCVLAALEESRIVLSLDFQIDVMEFMSSLSYWTKTNDEKHGDGKVRPSDARDMQSFYLEYYEKNIQALFKFLEDNRYFEGT